MNTATMNLPLPPITANTTTPARYAGNGTPAPVARHAASVSRQHSPAFAQPRDTRAVQQPRTDTVRHDNLIVFSSPSGGTGLSTLLALTALTLHQRNVPCALLDADLGGGGLDVLLGIEQEPGLSMQDLDAPLGHIDGEALNLELPHWERMPVLAHTPWRGDDPDHWQIQAAMQAMCEANQLVLADIGRAQMWERIPESALSVQVVAVELSVLGLARAKAHMETLKHIRASFAGIEAEPPIIVAMEPRGAPRRSAATTVATAEAIAYLGADVLGPVRQAPTLCSDILKGLGIQRVPRRNRRILRALAEQLARWSDARGGEAANGSPCRKGT